MKKTIMGVLTAGAALAAFSVPATAIAMIAEDGEAALVDPIPEELVDPIPEELVDPMPVDDGEMVEITMVDEEVLPVDDVTDKVTDDVVDEVVNIDDVKRGEDLAGEVYEPGDEIFYMTGGIGGDDMGSDAADQAAEMAADKAADHVMERVEGAASSGAANAAAK